MRTKNFTVRALAGFTLLGCLTAADAAAQGKVDDYLARAPMQAGVLVTTPTGPELATCRAEQVAWAPQGNVTPKGVVVKDAQGRLVRQFIDSKGVNKTNIWSYYLNGVESYREIDSNGNGKPDQFRWLGVNGGKYGHDIDEDGKIDAWSTISAEELSQELFQAMLTKDAKRLDALLVSEGDLKTILGLPDAEIAKVMARRAGAIKKMTDTADALKLTDKSRWIHLELGLGTTTPADTFQGRTDLIKQRSATALVDKGDKAEQFATGELILVGGAWKLVDGPSYGQAVSDGATGGSPVSPAIQALLAELDKIPQPKVPADNAPYHTARAAIYEKIVGATTGTEQEPWLKLVVDSYTAAAEAGPADGPAMARLEQWFDTIEKNAPKSAAAAYAAFRYASAEYSIKIADPKADVMKIQVWLRERLEGFVTKYPQSEDAPEAMIRLAIAHEFAGKDGEAAAKNWYEKLAKDYSGHPNAARAQGAVKRLQSEGQPFTLTGQTLDNMPFTMANAAGKVVIVYYWATWSQATTADLKQLSELAKEFGPKGLVIVTASLDDEAAKATQALAAAQIPGFHLHAAGGLESSPLAVAYGIQMVPHMFLVNKEGKVANRNAQGGAGLKDELEKLLK